MSIKEEQVKRIQEGLQCSKEEAENVYAYDLKVEKSTGGQEYDLTKEQEKEAKKWAHTKTRKPTVYNFNQRERKSNPTKAGVIAEIAKFLQENAENLYENVEITNKERQIAFKIGENNYELTLIQKRKAKN